ncbi:hypothetical protein L7F22_016504 [Adiantum nelumboides]|nr:hypothetical protein [Adiantum nelumboides]MCO5558317.1 hypothetical protein [Adiantum nelumboides]MCO5558335.1 hypothetical protein [Adiantum nelumboides]MCO5562172.1 hypothetical protein [Adiantum nelumboides]MCO5562858.1 hypothetical protein [Adiantum nelumboides]
MNLNCPGVSGMSLIGPGEHAKTHHLLRKLQRKMQFGWMDRGMKQAEVMISGPGPGKDTALQAIRRSSIILSFVRDVTPMPYNGCRPPRKRRV